MIAYNQTVIPFVGTEIFRLYESYENIKDKLDAAGELYSEELWQSEEETIQNPWTVIVVENTISLFFAGNSKLFKIVFWENYQGKIENGICLGMSMSEAQSIDNTLVYNDWDEIYESENGYWIEDEPATDIILSVTVYIKEIDDASFNTGEW